MRCPECSDNNVVTNPNEGESYCSVCGLVIDQVFDYSMHWYGEKGTSYSQTTFAKTYKGLGTIDPNGLPRHKGMKVTEEENIERNFSTALPALRVVWGLWQIPTTLREECAINYRKLIKKSITHGRNSYAMAIAITFILCDKYGIARNVDDLAKYLDLSTVAVSKCIKAISSA